MKQALLNSKILILYKINILADWLNDALAGKFGTGHKKEILVPEHGDGGPYVNQMKGGFALPERIGITDGSHPDQTGPEG